MRTTLHYLSSSFLPAHKDRGAGSVGALLYEGLQIKYSPCSIGLATSPPFVACGGLCIEIVVVEMWCCCVIVVILLRIACCSLTCWPGTT